MTDSNKTLIIGILDRSGSMRPLREDMEGGFDHFIEEQKKVPGECLVSLYQFDDRYDTVYEVKPIAEVPPMSLVPRGNTALFDAVGKTIVTVGEQLGALPEDKRPGAVIVMIVTDGQENASGEYTLERVRELVKTQTEAFKWRFIYLGSDMSTLKDAQALEIKSAARFGATGQGVRGMYESSSASVGNYRRSVQRGNKDADIEIDQDLTDKK